MLCSRGLRPPASAATRRSGFPAVSGRGFGIDITAGSATIWSRFHFLTPVISAREFLQSLMSAGEARVLVPGEPPDDTEWDDALQVVEASWRLHVPAPVPEFNPPAARWAARILYRACQFLVWRDAGPELVTAALREAPPAAADEVSRAYSADLCLRYLPSLHRSAARLAPEDVLVGELRCLAFDWPLSSVGVPGLEPPPQAGNLLDHPGVRRLYADRILAAGDHARLLEPAAAGAVREALGAHPELAPAMAAKLGWPPAGFHGG